MSIHRYHSMNQPKSCQVKYIELGCTPIPVPRGEKGPILRGWHNLRVGNDPEKYVHAYFSEPSNVALLLGEASGGLNDPNSDSSETSVAAQAMYPRLLELGLQVIVRPSVGIRHALFRVSAEC